MFTLALATQLSDFNLEMEITLFRNQYEAMVTKFSQQKLPV